MITIGQNVLSLADFSDIVFNNKAGYFTRIRFRKIETNFQFLQKLFVQ